MSDKAIVDLKGHMEIINMLTAKCNELAEKLAAEKQRADGARQAAIADVVSTIKEMASGSHLDVFISTIERLATLTPAHQVVPVEPTEHEKEVAAERSRCAEIARNYRNPNPYPTIYEAIAKAIEQEPRYERMA